MKKSTIIPGLMLIAFLAFGVYQLEFQGEGLRDELREVHRQLISDKQAIHILKAEWVYLTQPERLSKLVEEHLTMQPIATSQVKDIGALPMRRQKVSMVVK